MKLSALHIHNLRIIKDLKLKVHPTFNIITGRNGSGKTALLESIYLLGTGRSFRSREAAMFIAYDEDNVTCFATTEDDQRISLQKSRHKPTIAKINQSQCQAASQLAAFLPCHLFNEDMFDFVHGAPSLRRKLMDWGLFHVEHAYHGVWKAYMQALKERNVLLKKKVTAAHVKPWNYQLNHYATMLDAYRATYFDQLNKQFKGILNELSALSCYLQYYKGWDKKNEGLSLEEILNNSFEKDSFRQFTHYGPHQADFYLTNEQAQVKQSLSRGQQKIALFALKFAQSALLKETCIFLIDDLAAELDIYHIEKLLKYMHGIDGQFFIAIHSMEYIAPYLPKDKMVFLLENGKVAID